ncbi:telomere-associated protein RIF1 [Nilaparvata lugens]|uniref:telomere-associated protein RIF1 n=1 Tax=Nilaparvata lugens TaxID=108931 RepID=UPI00193E8001|nr:telomere-associated protein RIF1 [Nilaparvata lugens]
MERYTELKAKIVASIEVDDIEKNVASVSQSISEFSDIINTSDKAASAARDDLSILIPLFNKYVLSTNTKIRQASVSVFTKLQAIFTENFKLKKSDWWEEYKNSIEGNCQKLAVLIGRGCDEWPIIWCTMTRLVGDELLSCVKITNCLCKIIEKAFKNKAENKYKEVENGYRCWMVIVECFTMSKEPLKKSKVDFLLMPFKSPSIAQSKTICEVKLEVFFNTLLRLGGSDEANIDSVLPLLINYMFNGEKAACKSIAPRYCADLFINILKIPKFFKRQTTLLINATATCMDLIKDNEQLSELAWITVVDSLKKHIENVGVDNPSTHLLFNELVSVIDKLASILPSVQFADLLMICIQGKYKLLPLKYKFKMLIDIAMKPKHFNQLKDQIYNVIVALLRLFAPKERTEKIFSVALDALQIVAADTENNDQKTDMPKVLGEAWRAIAVSLNESLQWIDVTAQFICPYFLFPVKKNVVKYDPVLEKDWTSSWKTLLSACMKVSTPNKKNIIDELIKHFASLETESYATSLVAFNMMSDICESFDATPYYSGVVDGLLKKSNSDSLNGIIQPLLESMLKYAKKNHREAHNLLEIANKLSNSKHDVSTSMLSKFFNNMAMIENTTPEKSSKFLHRLAKAKEIQSQNNNRSPSSSPKGLFHLNSIEKKSSPLSKFSPSVKTARKTIDEESSQDFVMVPPKPKKTVLTNHQKEMLSTRRCDIPALYQDLSQDTMSMDSMLTAGTIDGQDKSILIKRDQTIVKDGVIQSLCEDAVGFDCEKPAIKTEIVEEKEIIEETQVLEKVVDVVKVEPSCQVVVEDESSCQPIEEHQDDNTKKVVSSNDVVAENQCKESKENGSDIPIQSTDEVVNQNSDDTTSEKTANVSECTSAVDEQSGAVVHSTDATALPPIETMETEDSVAAVPKPDTKVNGSVDQQEIEGNNACEQVTVKTRKSATPLRKSVRKNKNKISPIKLLGKRRSLSTTGIDVTKSPSTAKRTKLQSRKSIAVVQPHSHETTKHVTDVVKQPSNNVQTSEDKESSANGVSKITKEPCDTAGASVSKTEEIEDTKTVASSNATSQGRKSVTKQRKRALEKTTSETGNFEEKSPTLKKRLRKSLGATINSNSPGIVRKKLAIKNTKEVEETGKHSTENSETELSEFNSKNDQNKAVVENSAETKSVEELKNNKNDETTNPENNSSTIEDKTTRKLATTSTDTTPKRQRVTPRITSKKKSPCACCSEDSFVSPRVKRKGETARTLFAQSTPSRKIEKNAKQLTGDKKEGKELNNSVLSELNCIQASSASNTDLSPRKNEVLQLTEADQKPEIGSPTSNDSAIIDIHISEKEKMEFENCTLIENCDGKENQEFNLSPKKKIPEESHNEKVIEDLKAKLCTDITKTNKEIHSKDETVKESVACADQKPDEDSDLKGSTEVPKSKNKHKGLDSWLIRSPKVGRDKDSHDESATKENPELNESNLSNHTDAQGVSAVSDSDESFIVSSQQPTDSVIKIKRQSNSFAKKQAIEDVVAPSCTEKDVVEKCITSQQSPKQMITESNVETEKKSDSLSKSHVCRRLLDNLEKNEEENENQDEYDQGSENESDLSLINDDVYCRILSQEATEPTNEICTEETTVASLISTKEESEVSRHISNDHDYVSPSRNQNAKADENRPSKQMPNMTDLSVCSNDEASSRPTPVDACQTTNKPVDKTTVPDVSSVIDEQVATNKTSLVIDDFPNKKNDTVSSKNNCKDVKIAKLSSPDRSKMLLSPSRATRIKRMVMECSKESPKINGVCDPSETKMKVDICSPEREVNRDELGKLVSPPTAFKSKQSVSPDQSSTSKQRSASCPPSPSRALRIKRLIESKSSAEETAPVCSSPKKASLSSPSKKSIENMLSSPPRTSRFEKPLVDSRPTMRSPEKSVSLEVQEGGSCVASSPQPQSARGRSAQLLGLVSGDSPAQFRRHQQTPKRIRPIRIITASDVETHEGEDWVCRTYSPSAVPSPSILKTRLRTDDVSPQSSPSVTRPRLSDDLNETSPPNKKKRVNFHDPPLTQKLFFFKTGSGKIVSQGRSSDLDPKSPVQETVTDVAATSVEPAESCSTTNIMTNNVQQTVSGSSSDNTDCNLPPASSASLKDLWSNVDEKEKLEFITNTIFENKELLGIALANVNCDLRKRLVETMCNDSEFVSLISKEKSVARCITEDIESLSDNICKLDKVSQHKLVKNIDESVKIKLLGDISPEMKVSIFSDDVSSNPDLLKQVHNKINVDDFSGEIASHLGSSSELGKKILEKADVDTVADLLISGINVLKAKKQSSG